MTKLNKFQDDLTKLAERYGYEVEYCNEVYFITEGDEKIGPFKLNTKFSVPTGYNAEYFK